LKALNSANGEVRVRGLALALLATGSVVAAAALSPLGTGVARAAVVQSVDFTAKVVRADRNKARGGLTLRTVLRISDDTGAKPPPLTQTLLRFPKGAVVNARYFSRCSRSALERGGPRACPSRSRIGAGTSRADARPIVPSVNARITMFNGQPQGGNPTILIHAIPDLSSPITLEGVLRYQRSGPYGYVLDVPVPPIPTLPGQPNASVTFFDATTLDRTVRRRGRRIHYIEGPVVCNGTFFLLDGEISYEGRPRNPLRETFTLTGGPRCPRPR
jgi:hypothetical protein